ncbi:glycoside hydrolase family 18 protein [Vibrio alginolyticus]|uniref:glycoside hydrolase family 18 protein n=1 Tax=Vibrio alginolyticus TaxID=663 RepID=UPI00215C6C8E|nr:glycoside hydrolase family 18 protein [Vibrio alginolyticus]MCS0002809.1 glycoside hydrolase family 18 protein [Vibrio alginolyticus]
MNFKKSKLTKVSCALLTLLAINAKAEEAKNVIYVSKKEKLINNVDVLKMASHVILFTMHPCESEPTIVCGDTFSPGISQKHPWGYVTIDDESLKAIKTLQSEGVKILFDMAPIQSFYPKVTADPSIYEKLAISISDMINHYSIDGFDYDFEPVDINATNPDDIKSFFKTLRYLMPEKELTITPQFYTLNSTAYRNVYDAKTSPGFFEDLSFMNVQYYDVGEKFLNIDTLLSWHRSMVSGEYARIPPEKLVTGFALGVNDTIDRWAFEPSIIANYFVVHNLANKKLPFGGVMGWRFLNNTFYGQNWLVINHRLFQAASANLIDNTSVISPDAAFIYSSSNGLMVYKDNTWVKSKKMPYLANKTKLLSLSNGFFTIWDGDNFIFTSNNSAPAMIDLFQLKEQFGTTIDKIFYVVNDEKYVYIVTNVGVYRISYNLNNDWDEPEYIGLWNMPSGGYTGAAVSKNSLFVTLNGNRGVYKYNANSGGFEPSNSGLPTYMGETTINEIVAQKNCLRVKIFGDFYYSKNNGDSWHAWSDMPKYFDCNY